MIPESHSPMAAGTKIGPYEVLGWLGAGGMGVVYRARDARLDRDVAIKVLPDTLAADAGRLRRFEQEARAAGQLNHPNIAAVYDVGTHAGAPYIVSELLEGESLRSRLHTGALPIRKAIEFARQIAEGLAAAHDKQIVHRDVKPDNVFITRDGRVKILDFGIAKLARPDDQHHGRTGMPTQTEAGTIVGTAAYMSPEQVRSEAVDARSDLFSFGAVLYEMLARRPAFARETVPETMTAILKSEPSPLPGHIPPALTRIALRCLEKTRDMRFQSARDLAFGLEMLTDTGPAAPPTVPVTSTRWRSPVPRAIGAITVAAALALWVTRGAAPDSTNPLADATFSRFTNWPGSEGAAAISPDGRFVAFLADRDGEVDLWLSQVGTGNFVNLTRDSPPLAVFRSGDLIQRVGFSGDGSEIWSNFSGADRARKMLVPLTGGVPRAFLEEGDNAPSWSPDGSRMAFFNDRDGDPLFIADGTGADAQLIRLEPSPKPGSGLHQHNPVWSTDGEWIYFVRGSNPTVAMDIWRVRPSGGSAEQMTDQNAAMNFLAALNARTLLYVARSDDRQGPWLWALDTVTKRTRRVTTGLDQYTSVSASRDGRRVVATVANPTANLWRVALTDRQAEDGDVTPYALPTDRALAPRFGGASLFYLSARGTADGLWRFQNGEAVEVWKGANGALSEPAAISRDGNRAAVIIRREGKAHLTLLSADGSGQRAIGDAIGIRGAADQGIMDWSPDGNWIVVGGADAKGPGLFKVPADGGTAVRLATGQAVNPVWSPDDTLIVYSGTFVAGQAELRGVRPDGTPVVLPPLRVRQGGYRFVPHRHALVYLPTNVSLDFWLLDLQAGTTRQLTHLTNRGGLRTFDVTPDGREIVFDRTLENSDIVQIDFAR